MAGGLVFAGVAQTTCDFETVRQFCGTVCEDLNCFGFTGVLEELVVDRLQWDLKQTAGQLKGCQVEVVDRVRSKEGLEGFVGWRNTEWARGEEHLKRALVIGQQNLFAHHLP